MNWIWRFCFVLFVSIASTANANDRQQIDTLLRDFLANTVDDDLKNHQRFWSDELIYTSSSGLRFDKQKILTDIQSASSTEDATEPQPSYSAEETDIRLYGRTAIVAFKLVANWVEADEQKTQTYFNTGTLLKRKGLWQVVAWQATKIPPDKTNE